MVLPVAAVPRAEHHTHHSQQQKRLYIHAPHTNDVGLCFRSSS